MGKLKRLKKRYEFTNEDVRDHRNSCSSDYYPKRKYCGALERKPKLKDCAECLAESIETEKAAKHECDYILPDPMPPHFGDQ